MLFTFLIVKIKLTSDDTLYINTEKFTFLIVKIKPLIIFYN